MTYYKFTPQPNWIYFCHIWHIKLYLFTVNYLNHILFEISSMISNIFRFEHKQE